MNNYKINFIYNGDNDINEIFIKVLKKEIINYIKTNYDGNNYEKFINIDSFLNDRDDID